MSTDDDDVGLHVLGCRADILGTNCKTVSTDHNWLLKRKESRSGFEPRSLCLPAECLTARPDRITMPLTRKYWMMKWCAYGRRNSRGNFISCYVITPPTHTHTHTHTHTALFVLHIITVVPLVQPAVLRYNTLRLQWTRGEIVCRFCQCSISGVW